MASLGQTFDVATLPASSGNYEPLPAGLYDARITEAGILTTASGTGRYIKIRFAILGPSGAGRMVFAQLNIENASAKAEEIGRQQLGELMRALGLQRVDDTDQLMNGECQIKLGVRPERTDPVTGRTYPASNEVVGYKGYVAKSAAPALNVVNGAAAPAPAKPTERKASPPWAKK